MTLLGEIVASLPIDVRLGKLVVYGYLFGVLVIILNFVVKQQY